MDSYTKKINNAFLFYLFTLKKLPTLWFWGLKVTFFDGQRCCIRIAYSWFTKNPFRSIYFSALSGAAELSTGLLVQKYAVESGQISMLVVKSEAEFLKKAKGHISFCCEEGDTVQKLFATLQKPGDTGALILHTNGVNEAGEIVARFIFTWSIKRK